MNNGSAEAMNFDVDRLDGLRIGKELVRIFAVMADDIEKFYNIFCCDWRRNVVEIDRSPASLEAGLSLLRSFGGIDVSRHLRRRGGGHRSGRELRKGSRRGMYCSGDPILPVWEGKGERTGSTKTYSIFIYFPRSVKKA